MAHEWHKLTFSFNFIFSNPRLATLYRVIYANRGRFDEMVLPAKKQNELLSFNFIFSNPRLATLYRVIYANRGRSEQTNINILSRYKTFKDITSFIFK
jgi:hypothetical protein